MKSKILDGKPWILIGFAVYSRRY